MAQTAAQRQAEAEADIERIVRGFREELELLGVKPHRNQLRHAVMRLLQQDVIRVGKRPEVHEPIEGQTTIDEHLDPFELEDLCDADD